MKTKTYMIEGARPLELVKRHISEVKRVREANFELCKELGVERVFSDRQFGTLSGVVFPRGKHHPDFTKAKSNGCCYPKKGSAWAKRFAAQVGYASVVKTISEAFNVPLHVSVSKPDGSLGSSCIGPMLTECGFLYLSADGPYAMWVPDVAAAVALEESEGWTVAEPAKSFKLDVVGLRPIEDEEWEILALQHKLERKKRESNATPL